MPLIIKAKHSLLDSWENYLEFWIVHIFRLAIWKGHDLCNRLRPIRTLSCCRLCHSNHPWSSWMDNLLGSQAQATSGIPETHKTYSSALQGAHESEQRVWGEGCQKEGSCEKGNKGWHPVRGNLDGGDPEITRDIFYKNIFFKESFIHGMCTAVLVFLFM